VRGQVRGPCPGVFNNGEVTGQATSVLCSKLGGLGPEGEAKLHGLLVRLHTP
jgi:hypothetical protein